MASQKSFPSGDHVSASYDPAAVGCSDYLALQARIASCLQGGEIRFATRFRPRRADELVGSRLHFIVKHMLVRPVEILSLDDRSDGRVDIVCVAELECVHPQPNVCVRAGVICEADAPKSVDDARGTGDLPPELYRELAELNLI